MSSAVDIKTIFKGLGIDEDVTKYFADNGYISLNKLLSFLSRIAILLSDRGLGKSHLMRKFLIKLFLLLQQRFVCLYRTKNDRDSAIKTWMDQFYIPPARETFGPLKREDFKWKRLKHSVELYYQDDPQPIGYFLCVAHVNAIKQMSFPENIRWGWLDEMLPEAWTKLPGIDNEGDAIMKIMDTIEHDTLHRQMENGYPRVRWVMFGNMTNLRSPLLQYFGIKPYKYGFYRGKLKGAISKDVMIEHVPPVVPAMTGNYSNAARIYLLDPAEEAFIKPKPLKAKILRSIRIREGSQTRFYHMYTTNEAFHRWICQKDKHIGEPKIRTGTIEGKREDEENVLTPSLKKEYLRYYSLNLLQFDSVYTKMNFINDIM